MSGSPFSHRIIFVGIEMAKSLDLVGKRFGRLKVLKFAGSRKAKGQSRRFWRCRCSCGEVLTVVTGALRSGNTQSCGCLRVDRAGEQNLIHGLSGTFEHRIWKGIRRRCNNPKDVVFSHYGGRGIRVCRRWDSFEKFFLDMGEAPGKNYSIERQNPNGNYTPKNCIWLLRRKQNRNRRDTIYLELNGVRKPALQWAEELGIPYSTVRMRYFRGESPERCLTIGRVKRRWRFQPT